MGQSAEINWSGDFPGNVKLKLFKGNTFITNITTNTANNGTYTWNKVPFNLSQRSDYRIKVVAVVNNKIVGFSENFSIVIPPIQVTLPTDTTEWKRGYKHEIHWTGGKPNGYVAIKLLKNGVYLKTLTASSLNDGLFKWKVPAKETLGNDFSIKVVYLQDTSLKDTSDTFTIINSPVGTWTQEQYSNGVGGTLRLNIRKNNTLDGYFYIVLQAYGLPNIQVPLSGAYTYNFDTGQFTSSLIKGSVYVQGVKIKIEIIGVSGSLENHRLIGTISQIRITASQGGYSETESIYNGQLFMKR
jgi:hypothetical protein